MLSVFWGISMPTIAMVTPKGEAGKSTSAVILGSELVHRGAAVTIIDADPNKPVSDWAKLPGRPDNLAVLANVTEENIIEEIETAAQKTPFVIVDLEGTASMTVADAVSRADLVIIPTQGSQLDAKQATRAIKLIQQQERAFGKKIPYAILFSRTSGAIRPRTLQHIKQEFERHGMQALTVHMHEREAFRAIFSFGGTVENLNPKLVSNLAAAISNARALAAEVVSLLRKAPSAEEDGAENEQDVVTAEVA
jgi:chromosome partitioning protein